MASPITSSDSNGLLLLAQSTLEAQLFFLGQLVAERQIDYNNANPENQTEAISLTLNLTLKTLNIQARFPIAGDTVVTLDAQKVGTVFSADASPPTPTPTPTPAPTNSAAGVVYVPSQSISSYVTATYADLQDGSVYKGAVCYYASNGFIQATFPNPVLVSSVTVGGGFVADFGGDLVANAGVNGAKLQYSTDGTNWVDVWTVAGVTDSGVNQYVTHQITPAITARYWRLTGVPYVATSKFRFT